jgi:predicted RNA-binding protein YlqC (UPF0109 family)
MEMAMSYVFSENVTPVVLSPSQFKCYEAILALYRRQQVPSTFVIDELCVAIGHIVGWKQDMVYRLEKKGMLRHLKNEGSAKLMARWIVVFRPYARRIHEPMIPPECIGVQPPLSPTAQFLFDMVTKLVEHHEQVHVSETPRTYSTIINLRVHPDDLKIVIGRLGRNIDAIRRLMSIIDAKNKQRHVIELEE